MPCSRAWFGVKNQSAVGPLRTKGPYKKCSFKMEKSCGSNLILKNGVPFKIRINESIGPYMGNFLEQEGSYEMNFEVFLWINSYL